MVLWLGGEGPFDDEELDKALVAFVELVAGLLKVHPTWGWRSYRTAGGLGVRSWGMGVYAASGRAVVK
jgi:hypothetical protein